MPDAFELIGQIQQTFLSHLNKDGMLSGILKSISSYILQGPFTSLKNMHLKQIYSRSPSVNIHPILRTLAMDLFNLIPVSRSHETLVPNHSCHRCLPGPFSMTVVADMGMQDFLQKVVHFSYYNISIIIC